MRIVYHLGVHCTDEDRLLRCLLKNRGALAARGVAVPGPARYRPLLRDTLNTLKGEAATPETQAVLLQQIMDEEGAARMILSFENFLAFPQWALRRSFYPNGAQRMRALTRIFPDHEAEFFLGIRNPATFLPALFLRQGERSFDDFISGVDVRRLRWSDLVTQLRAVNPEVPITLWCDEDTPLLWPEILRVLADTGPDMVFEGATDFLATLMSPAGMEQLAGALKKQGPADAAGYRSIVSSHLAEFALPDRLEMEIDLPGWTEDLIAEITAGYDADVSRLAAMSGITFLLP